MKKKDISTDRNPSSLYTYIHMRIHPSYTYPQIHIYLHVLRYVRRRLETQTYRRRQREKGISPRTGRRAHTSLLLTTGLGRHSRQATPPMYIHLYTYKYACTYVSTHLSICTSIQVCIQTCMHAHTYDDVCVYVGVHVYVGAASLSVRERCLRRYHHPGTTGKN